LPDIQFVERVDNPKCQIAPMLLVPFVENAFKHGVATAPIKPYVFILLEEDSSLLTFEVRNNFRKIESTEKESLGLENVKRQLELLYTNEYELSIEKIGDEHSVRLKLNLEALNKNLI
jgi:LytS/YehU family sensor histidine kinase